MRVEAHLPVHTAPELWLFLVGPFCFMSTEVRWLIRDGDRGEGDEGVKARPQKPPEKDWRDCGPPPEQ